MAGILELPRRKEQSARSLLERNEMFRSRLYDTIFRSFLVVEDEVVPLLNEIATTLDHVIGDANTDTAAKSLPDGALESAQSAAAMANKVLALIECYRSILTPDPH